MMGRTVKHQRAGVFCHRVSPFREVGPMAKRQWNEKSFFEQLHEECSEAACAVARHLLEWFDKQGYKVGYGNGKKWGTLFPYIDHHAQNRVCKLFEILTHDYGNPGCVLLASYLWKKE